MRRLVVIAAAVGLAAGVLVPVPVAATADPSGGGADAWSLEVSRSTDRSAARPLDGAMVGLDESVAIFLAPLDREARHVDFWLNGKKVKRENHRPYDLKGTLPGKGAKLIPSDHSGWVEGENTIDAVIRQRSGERTTVTATFVRATGVPTIEDVLAADDRLAGLNGALDLAGLLELFADPEAEFTVFAPNNEAFSDLGPLFDLIIEDPALLFDVLAYHVAPERSSAADLLASGRLTTLQGADVGITGDLGDLRINEALVVVEDIPAANGVIHIIDTVLLPPPPAPNGTITGAIVDVDGQPVPGAKANLFTIEDGRRGSFLGRSDADDGSYRYSVEPGCYVIVLIAPQGTLWARNDTRFDQRRRCVEANGVAGFDSVLVDGVADDPS